MHRHKHPPGLVDADRQADRSVHRLARWQRWALDSAAAVLLLTGAVWLAVHYTVGAGAGALPHPVEAWSLRLHGLGAFAGLFVLGVLAAGHVPHGWHLSHRRHWAGQRPSGLALCGFGGLLAFSGYLLYYFAPEAVRPALGWAHAALGAAMGVVLLIHRRGRGHRHAG